MKTRKLAFAYVQVIFLKKNNDGILDIKLHGRQEWKNRIVNILREKNMTLPRCGMDRLIIIRRQPVGIIFFPEPVNNTGFLYE